MVSLGRKKVVCVLFFVFVISGVFLVGSVVGATVMPESSISAPEVVSVVVYNDPIWNPPTYTTNPFTGEVTEHSGTWSQNGTIEVTIKNRSFMPYIDEKGNYINVKYSFVWKAHFREWGEYSVGFGHFVVNQSDSDYTVVNFPYRMRESSSNPPYTLGTFESGSMIDFHVQASIGYSYRLNEHSNDWVYVGEISEWSEDYTVTMPPFVEQGVFPPVSSLSPNTSSSGKPSSSDSNNSLYQQKSFPGIFIVVVDVVLVFVCVIAILLAVIVYRRRQRRNRCGVGVVENVGCEVSSVE
jgi:hypothetical protein